LSLRTFVNFLADFFLRHLDFSEEVGDGDGSASHWLKEKNEQIIDFRTTQPSPVVTLINQLIVSVGNFLN
jgi:hypothetical protein